MFFKRPIQNGKPEEIEKPSGKWWWFSVFITTPVFFLIGLSIHNGWPPPDDFASWVFLIGLTIYPLTAQGCELLFWHLREKLYRPDWWTAQAQHNVAQAILLSFIFGILRLPEGSHGWAAAGQILEGMALAIAPMFAICCAVDWVIGRIGRIFTSRRTR